MGSDWVEDKMITMSSILRSKAFSRITGAEKILSLGRPMKGEATTP